jgi:transcriptional regulator with XRE-family HTH domain
MIRYRLRQLRLQKEFSQEYIAGKLNISQKAYSKIELSRTELTVSRLHEISIILDFSISEYLSLEFPKK